MKKTVCILIVLILGLSIYHLNDNQYTLELPKHFPEPIIPADNLLTKSKVELGRLLFFDKNLSINQSTSCATCHDPKKAFTDGRAKAKGALQTLHPRSSMSLANIAYAHSLNWADPLTDTLERQLLVPLFGEEPIEMGMNDQEEQIIEYLTSNKQYAKLFRKSFADKTINIENLTKALASFQRTLISGGSAYDKFLLGNDQAMSESALRGMNLFFNEKFECFHCHGGFNFSDSSQHTNEVMPAKVFHNTGLYNLDVEGKYPEENQGVFSLTQNPNDMGHFKAPTLRNISLTAPYMHDGSINSLSEVLDHYANGGRAIVSGPYTGDGSKNPLKNKFIKGFDLSVEERTDLLEFLKSLTDEQFVNNPDYQSPN